MSETTIEVREIQLRRRETKSYLPAPIIGDSKKYLSSIYSGQGPLRGVSGEEEKRLLSSYLGMDAEERNFGKVCREFWADLRVEIPSDGKTLNISTDKNGNPVNTLDYLIFKFAEVHPYVAENRNAMLDNSKKMFYIYDPEEEVKNQNRTVTFKKKAYAELIKMGEDEEKIDRMVRLLTESDPHQMSIAQKQNYLDQLIEENPQRFVVYATDKDLEIKSIISEMVSESIITKMGNQYWFIDEKIGDTLEDAVRFFKDKKRSEDVNRMKAKLQEKRNN